MIGEDKRPPQGWHSEHYDNMAGYRDRMEGPIWDALMDAGDEGLTLDGIVNALVRDLRVRQGMSFYLSFGYEQANRTGSEFEQCYLDYPNEATPEERFRYVVRERLSTTSMTGADGKTEVVHQGRLNRMTERKNITRMYVQSGNIQGPKLLVPARWRANPDKPPTVWEPRPDRCEACGQKDRRQGRNRPWRRGEGLGPSIWTRTQNLRDTIATGKGNKTDMLNEAAELLAAWQEGKGDQ